jgi:hypothetical protein
MAYDMLLSKQIDLYCVQVTDRAGPELSEHVLTPRKMCYVCRNIVVRQPSLVKLTDV